MISGAEWLFWYALKIGLSYRETLALPVGELMDMIAFEQLKHEGAQLKGKKPQKTHWDIIPRDLR